MRFFLIAAVTVFLGCEASPPPPRQRPLPPLDGVTLKQLRHGNQWPQVQTLLGNVIDEWKPEERDTKRWLRMSYWLLQQDFEPSRDSTLDEIAWRSSIGVEQLKKNEGDIVWEFKFAALCGWWVTGEQRFGSFSAVADAHEAKLPELQKFLDEAASVAIQQKVRSVARLADYHHRDCELPWESPGYSGRAWAVHFQGKDDWQPVIYVLFDTAPGWKKN